MVNEQISQINIFHFRVYKDNRFYWYICTSTCADDFSMPVIDWFDWYLYTENAQRRKGKEEENGEK